jgi:hypothetical protein
LGNENPNFAYIIRTKNQSKGEKKIETQPLPQKITNTNPFSENIISNNKIPKPQLQNHKAQNNSSSNQ